jgi:hypothetical protein
VTGDPDFIKDKDGAVLDFSHLAYLEWLGVNIHDPDDLWAATWPSIEQLFESLVQAGHNNADLVEDSLEWRNEYGALATEMRIAKQFLNKHAKRSEKYKAFRAKSYKALAMAEKELAAREDVVMKEENEDVPVEV